MNPAIQQILVDNDYIGEWYESPCDVTFEEVAAFKAPIEGIVGRELDIDPHVQDATYITDIGLLDERYWSRKTRTGALVWLFALRFSCFGRMFTVHGTEWRERLGEQKASQVIDFLNARDFVYAPEEELRSPYDGPNKWKHGPETWWVRFFDYV